MGYRFLNVNMSVVTFKGISLSYQRRIALVATFLIWIGLAYAGILGAQYFGDSKLAEEVAIIVVLSTLLHYIAGGEFLLIVAAKSLLKITPLGVLYRQDKSVLDRAKAELLSIAGRVEFKDYLEYGKINPVIRSQKGLQVIAHQRKGDLQKWVGNVQNLKQLADLVYQIYLVERMLVEDNEPLLQPN